MSDPTNFNYEMKCFILALQFICSQSPFVHFLKNHLSMPKHVVQLVNKNICLCAGNPFIFVCHDIHSSESRTSPAGLKIVSARTRDLKIS
jgi:hypothetical protein